MLANKGCYYQATSCSYYPLLIEHGDKPVAHLKALNHFSHLQRCTLRGLRMGEHRILAPDG